MVPWPGPAGMHRDLRDRRNVRKASCAQLRTEATEGAAMTAPLPIRQDNQPLKKKREQHEIERPSYHRQCC